MIALLKSAACGPSRQRIARAASEKSSEMSRAQQAFRVARRFCLAAACLVLIPPSAAGQLRPNPAALASAPAELLDQLRADAFTYFRFINRAWVASVCEAFADVPDVPLVRLHGDAHIEQFAVTKDAWGLDDFDDSARGPLFVDIVRFLGSIGTTINICLSIPT